MAKFDVDIGGATYEVDAPDERTAWKWANATHAKGPKDYKAMSTPLAVNPTEGMGVGEKMAAGAGKAVYDLGLGVRQLLGLAQPGEVEQTRERDAPLMGTTSGKVGNFLGNVGAFMPTMLVPGANTLAGATLLGGGMGAAAPTVEGESRALNVGLGAAGGAAGKVLGDKVSQFVANRLAASQAAGATAAAQNAPRDAALAAARAEGYAVPPTTVNPSATNRVIESIGGKAATAQQASTRNQGITNNLVRRALGLNADDALTEDALQALRVKAGQAYQAIKDVPGRFNADAMFARDLSALSKDFSTAAREFPDIVKDEAIQTLQKSLAKPDMSPTAAMEVIKKLRSDATSNFKAFDDPAKIALAKAQRQAADAVEGLIERNLIRNGQGNLVPAFRDARTLIAKTHDVEAALLEGGNVSAKSLAKIMDKKGNMTGDLEKVAKFAANFERSAQNPTQAAGAGVSNLAPYGSALLGGAGFGVGGPVGGVAGALAPLVAPPAARSVMLSDLYQRLLATPSYGPSAGQKALSSVVLNPAFTPALTFGGAQDFINRAQ